MRKVQNPLSIMLSALLLWSAKSFTQTDRWQQHIDYEMQIDFETKSHQFKGEQKVVYTNNSPETLHKFFYHLYFNAFQPGSMMDVRSRSIIDPDRRVTDRISKLKENEMGYHKVIRLTQDGEEVKHHMEGTILEVRLAKPIEPGESSTFEMTFESQVPLQIRRSGRDNAEGIDYSMSQWYPKVCEYDYQGWHANPYVGREFHGVWGDFDVKISIDKKYTLAGGGIIQNKEKIGKGYAKVKKPRVKKGKLIWHFKAENVHDFVWAADRNYVVKSREMHDGTLVYFAYQPGEKTNENWRELPKIMDVALEYMNKNYGKYPYPVYSFIQAGDGGMEYPMATLITGERTLGSLVGVSVHEWMHSWYQMVLGTNESLYPWMDEGFASFASSETMNYLRGKKLIPGEVSDDPLKRSIEGYLRFSKSGIEQPMNTHADHFKANQAYGVSAYTKGAVCLTQLEYIMGKRTFRSALLKYFETWKFKHPNANDFFRVMEKESGLELDWFKEYFINTTEVPDYAIGEVEDMPDGKTSITLYKLQQMPMPQEVTAVLDDGTSHIFYIPLRMMRGEKKFKDKTEVTVLGDWPWTHPSYNFRIETGRPIESVRLDIGNKMVDGNRENNEWERE